MTEAEAKTILEIMLTADGGCYVCTGNLLQQFVEKFPEFKQMAEEMYKKEHDGMEMTDD